jgi:hypothetical protein
MRYMLDTNAISDAAADPDLSERLVSRRDGWHPVITMTVIAELFDGLADHPLNGRLIRACRLILDLWALFPRCVAPDNVVGMLAEYHMIPSTISALPKFQAQEIKRSLTAASLGQFDPAFRIPRAKTKELMDHQESAWQQQMLGSTNRLAITHPWSDELKHSPERKWKTVKIIADYLEMMSLDVSGSDARGKVEGLAHDVWWNPKSVPFWTGAVRLTLYGNWFHDRLLATKNSRTKTQEAAAFKKLMRDMYNLQSCLLAEAIVTSDRRWRDCGKIIFEEVGWFGLEFCQSPIPPQMP